MFKFIKVILIILFINSAYCQNCDSIKLIDKLYKNLNRLNSLNIDAGFSNVDTLKTLDKVILVSTNSDSKHIIKYEMEFSSFEKNVPIENNLTNFKKAKIYIDEKKFNMEDITLWIGGKYKNIAGLPIDFFNLGSDIDNGSIKYYKDNQIEYILIKGGILGCNGFNCSGYYTFIIKILNDDYNICAIASSEVFPLGFKNIDLYKSKNSFSPSIMIYNSEQIGDTNNVLISSSPISRFENIYEKDEL